MPGGCLGGIERGIGFGLGMHIGYMLSVGASAPELTLWRRHWLGHTHHNGLLLAGLVHAHRIVLLHAVRIT